MEMTVAGTMQIQIRTTTQTEILFIREIQLNLRCRKRQHRISGHKEQLKMKTVRFRKAPSACTDARLSMRLGANQYFQDFIKTEDKKRLQILQSFFCAGRWQKARTDEQLSHAITVLDKKLERGSAGTANVSVCCNVWLDKENTTLYNNTG